MDKDIVKTALENYTRKYFLLNKSYEREMVKPDTNIQELDEQFDRRYNKLVDLFIEEIKGA